jgi:membrane peptidoglycan carboxypeptidase
VKRIARTLACVVFGGLLLAGAAFPVAALAGVIAKTASDSYEDLPGSLRTPATAQTTYVYANDGRTLLTEFYDEDRRDVALSQVATVMRQAIVAAEDTRFYQHGGVDLKAVARALVADRGGQAAQGASTLTMQYVRNVLKSDTSLTQAQRDAATADTPARKIQEIRYANALEQQLTKQQILERYLNIAYFGAGAYGIYAAAERYFSVEPSQLTLAQAALIAGLVQSPDTDNPISGDRSAAVARQSYVLDSMAKMGVITTAQATGAKAGTPTLTPREQPNNCAAISSPHNDWGFFCDYFRQWWDTQAQFGATVADRENALKEGGYTVVTSLDPNVQADALTQSLSVYGYGNKRALPIAVVQPGTGRVLAMAVNRHYSLDANPNGQKYPNTVNNLVAGGGSVDGYPSGSTFKIFTMLAALESGKTLDTSFNAPSPLVTTFSASGDGSCGGKWCPVNDNPSWMDGQRTMWTGFGRSVNTYFVWLEEQIGPAKAVAMAQRLGITFRAASDARLASQSASSWGSFTLGVADTTPLDLANAYATLAAGGNYCAPLPVVSITDSAGAAVSAANPACKQVVSADVARAATDAARCPVGQDSAFGQCDGGTATQVTSILGGRPVAGKTGSSEHNMTETFVGFTVQLAAAGIAADPDDPKDYVGAGIASNVDSAVARVLASASKGMPNKSFTAPSQTIAFSSNDNSFSGTRNNNRYGNGNGN